MLRPAAVRALIFVILIAVFGCARQPDRQREVILFSIVGLTPFSDSVSTVNLDGSGQHRILSPKSTASYMYASGYTLRDPLLVVVHQSFDNKIEDKLFAYRLQDRTWEKVFTPPGIVGRGAFSPDHSRIVFVFAPGESAFYKLFVKETGTDQFRRLTTSEEPYEKEGYPSWRPDSKEVAFLTLQMLSGHLFSKLLRIPATGGQPQVILGPEDAPAGVSYSPDGRTLCILSKKGIEEVGLNGEGRRLILDWKVLPHAKHSYGCIKWSPTSNLIAFSMLSKETKKWEIWTVSAEGQNPKKIYTVPEGVVEGVFFLSNQG